MNYVRNVRYLPKMTSLDRAFLVFLAVVMYILGLPKIVICGIIVSLLILDYVFVFENQHANAYYGYPISGRRYLRY